MNREQIIQIAREAGLGFLLNENWLMHDELEFFAKLVAEHEQAQQAEPVAWATREDFYFELNRRVDQMRKEMVIKTVTMRCKEYDLALPIVDMYGGHIVVGQVITPPPRQPLTDEEIQTALNLKSCEGYKAIVRAIEAAHGITGEQK